MINCLYFVIVTIYTLSVLPNKKVINVSYAEISYAATIHIIGGKTGFVTFFKQEFTLDGA